MLIEAAAVQAGDHLALRVDPEAGTSMAAESLMALAPIITTPAALANSRQEHACFTRKSPALGHQSSAICVSYRRRDDGAWCDPMDRNAG
jgi:hypothetical protein